MRRCAVESCTNTDLIVLCHRFPKNRQSALNWQSNLNLDHIPVETLMSKYTVCCQHFNCTDYKNTASNSLNSNAIPQVEPSFPRKDSLKSSKNQEIQEQTVIQVNEEETANNSPGNLSDSIDLLYEDTGASNEMAGNLIGTPLGSDDICILPEEQNSSEALIQSIDGAGFTMLDAASCAFMNESKTIEGTELSTDLKLGNDCDSGASAHDCPPDNTDSDVEVLVSESIFESQWSETDCSAIVLRFDPSNHTDSPLSPCVSCRTDVSAKTNEELDSDYGHLDKKKLIDIIKQQSQDIAELKKKLNVFKSAQETLIGHFKTFHETVSDESFS